MNESNADMIKLPDGKYIMEWESDAVPFFFYDYELFVGEPMQQHNDMILKISKESGLSSKIRNDSGYEYKKNKIIPCYIIAKDVSHKGRIWTDQKFIAIWGGIEECPKGDFDIIIDLLEKKMGIKIWNNGYTVEVEKVLLQSGDWKYNHTDYESFLSTEYPRGEIMFSKFIPIEWYSGKRKPVDKRKYELEYRQLIHGESLITKFDEFLNERKNMGTIYHFTKSIEKLSTILNEDKLKAIWHSYISFTRNKNMWNFKFFGDNTNKYKIRIMLDGDRMSDKWKFEPFLYDQDRDFRNEAEERVNKWEMVGIIKYIKKISIRYPAIKPLGDGDLIRIDMLKHDFPNIEFEILPGHTWYGNGKVSYDPEDLKYSIAATEDDINNED